MPTIEDRIASLEIAFRNELRELRAKLNVAISNDLTWAERNWAWFALGAVVVGFVAGKV
jgi:hypothetical protein